jgi:hypothetical protein
VLLGLLTTLFCLLTLCLRALVAELIGVHATLPISEPITRSYSQAPSILRFLYLSYFMYFYQITPYC